MSKTNPTYIKHRKRCRRRTGALLELRLRLCLWLKPKQDCRSCCLFCRYFDDNCRWEVESYDDKTIERRKS